MDNLTLQYIAGFFDGEGSIGIYRQSNGGSLSYGLRTQLTQNVSPASTKLIEELKNRFGGSMSTQHTFRVGVDESQKLNIKYNWQLSSRNAVNFLTVILPFLVLKKEQAQIALIWQAQKPMPTRNAKGQICLTGKKNLKLDEKISIILKGLKNPLITDKLNNQLVKKANKLLKG